MSPAVSIIIPTLQEEKLIERTLSQFTPEIKKQFSLEIVVSDGGSTDRTVAIARRYADVIVESLAGQHQNISIGRNLGARASHGDILIFINADTIIEDIVRFLEEMIRVIQQPGVTGATCSVGIYREEEHLLDRLFHTTYNWYFYLLNVMGMGMGRGECHVVLRNVFFSLNGYNESIVAGEDYDLFLRLRRLGKIAFLRYLRVNESPRRYRQYGYLKISLLWFVNAVPVFLFRRSLHRKWKPIR